MAAATLKDIISTVTQGGYFTQLMAGHKQNGVPIASWTSPRNTGLSLTQIGAQFFAVLRGVVSSSVAGLFLDYGAGAPLTLFARSQFQLERTPAQFTMGQIRLTAVAGAPVQTFGPGEVTVGTPGNTSATRLYTNTTGGTLLPGGILDLQFTATAPGAAGNIPTDSPLALKTSYAGVSATNPQIGVTGTWITAAGQDEEGDDRLKVRCAARWSTLGCGGSEDALLFWALATPAGYAASPVAQVRVFASQLNGQIAGGAATVVVLGGSGPLPAPDLAAVAGNFENPRKYPIGCVLQVKNGTGKPITLTGVVSVYRNRQSIAEVQAGVAAALAAYQATLQMGQAIYTQRKVAGIIEDGAPNSIRDVDLGGMAAVITQAATELPQLSTAGLTYQLVDP